MYSKQPYVDSSSPPGATIQIQRGARGTQALMTEWPQSVFPLSSGPKPWFQEFSCLTLTILSYFLNSVFRLQISDLPASMHLGRLSCREHRGQDYLRPAVMTRAESRSVAIFTVLLNPAVVRTSLRVTTSESSQPPLTLTCLALMPKCLILSLNRTVPPFRHGHPCVALA